MPKARNPNRDKAFELFKTGKGKKKSKDIAAELGVSESLISRWKFEDEWEKKAGKKFTKKKRKSSQKKTAKEKQEESVKNKIIKALEKNEELTEKQKLFCMFFMDNRNATQAYLKAYRCSYSTAKTEGNYSLTKPHIKEEIERLKNIRNESLFISKEDIVERYMKIAFADITDFVQFRSDEVLVYSSDMVDGGIIAEVKQTKTGVSIKLEDRQKALEWLTNYFGMNSMHQHKKEYDKKVLEIREKQVNDGWL